MALCNLPAVITLSVILLASDCAALQMPAVLHTILHTAAQHANASAPKQLPSPTAAGYLPLESNATLYFVYYESQAPPTHETPIVLWLQVITVVSNRGPSSHRAQCGLPQPVDAADA